MDIKQVEIQGSNVGPVQREKRDSRRHLLGLGRIVIVLRQEWIRITEASRAYHAVNTRYDLDTAFVCKIWVTVSGTHSTIGELDQARSKG